MAADRKPRARRHPSHRDAIRIVPIHRPERVRVTRAAPPHLTYNNGPLLTSVQVFTVFWGSFWQQSAAVALLGHVNQFFDFVLTSALMDQLAEYSEPGNAISHGTRTGSAIVASPAPAASVTDAALRQFLQQQITGNAAFPRPSANTLYFLFLPSGTAVEQGGSQSCQQFCGYHDAIGSQIFYAVMPYPDCSGCLGSLSALDALTSTSSHELCEAITDPIPGEGWYDTANGEIGDICAWQTKQLGAYTVQLEWSNRAGKCL